jgi:xanthine dehydrogenase YagS FAD-binding subunit
MAPFEYLRATSIESVLPLLGQPGLQLLAGGTTLVDLMKLGVEAPTTVLDITPLRLDAIAVVDGRLHIGALATHTDVAQHALVKNHALAVSKALLSGASGQIRNVATIGGNVLQRTRCSYFRGADWRCNKRSPGAGCDAIEGLNGGHAVLGVSDACSAVHASDLAVALLALDATVHVRSVRGARRLPLADFYRLPGTTPHLEHGLSADELITHLELPLSAEVEAAAETTDAPGGSGVKRGSDYLKLRGRASYEFATVSVAASLAMRDGRVAALTVALGGVGTIPWRVPSAELMLMGQPLTHEIVERFCDALLALATPTSQNSHKLDMARGAVWRVLETLQ